MSAEVMASMLAALRRAEVALHHVCSRQGTCRRCDALPVVRAAIRKATDEGQAARCGDFENFGSSGYLIVVPTGSDTTPEPAEGDAR